MNGFIGVIFVAALFGTFFILVIVHDLVYLIRRWCCGYVENEELDETVIPRSRSNSNNSQIEKQLMIDRDLKVKIWTTTPTATAAENNDNDICKQDLNDEEEGSSMTDTDDEEDDYSNNDDYHIHETLRERTVIRSQEPQINDSHDGPPNGGVVDIEDPTFSSETESESCSCYDEDSISKNNHGRQDDNNKIGVNNKVIENPETTIITTSSKSSNDDNYYCCSICLDVFQDGSVVSVSNNPSCRHMFHRDCIALWLLNNDGCPCCRVNYLES